MSEADLYVGDEGCSWAGEVEDLPGLKSELSLEVGASWMVANEEEREG